MALTRKIRSLHQLLDIIEDKTQLDFLNELKTNPANAIRNIAEDPSADEYSSHPIKSLRELQERMRNDPYIVDAIRSDPEGFFRRAVKEAPMPEFKIYRILVASLCAVVIIIILGVLIAWLTKNSREAPTLITAVACTTLGLLAGIFVSVPGKEMKNTAAPPSP